MCNVRRVWFDFGSVLSLAGRSLQVFLMMSSQRLCDGYGISSENPRRMMWNERIML